MVEGNKSCKEAEWDRLLGSVRKMITFGRARWHLLLRAAKRKPNAATTIDKEDFQITLPGLWQEQPVDKGCEFVNRVTDELLIVSILRSHELPQLCEPRAVVEGLDAVRREMIDANSQNQALLMPRNFAERSMTSTHDLAATIPRTVSVSASRFGRQRRFSLCRLPQFSRRAGDAIHGLCQLDFQSSQSERRLVIQPAACRIAGTDVLSSEWERVFPRSCAERD